jgi:hypothetical protein
MREHKYLRRLCELIDRIEQWEKIKYSGRVLSSDEWNKMLEARDDTDELMRLCKRNVDYRVPGYRLKKSNDYWKQYNPKNMKGVGVHAAREVADIFKNKNKRK